MELGWTARVLRLGVVGVLLVAGFLERVLDEV